MTEVNALQTAIRILKMGASGPIGDLAAAYAAREVLNEFIEKHEAQKRESALTYWPGRGDEVFVCHSCAGSPHGFAFVKSDAHKPDVAKCDKCGGAKIDGAACPVCAALAEINKPKQIFICVHRGEAMEEDTPCQTRAARRESGAGDGAK